MKRQQNFWSNLLLQKYNRARQASDRDSGKHRYCLSSNGKYLVVGIAFAGGPCARTSPMKGRIFFPPYDKGLANGSMANSNDKSGSFWARSGGAGGAQSKSCPWFARALNPDNVCRSAQRNQCLSVIPTAKLYKDRSLSAVSTGEAVVPASELRDVLKHLRGPWPTKSQSKPPEVTHSAQPTCSSSG